MQNEWIRLISGAGLLGLAALGSTDGLVTGLSKQQVGDGVEVKVTGTDLGKPRELRVLGGSAYILEFDAKLKGSAKKLNVDYAGVSSVRAGWYRSKPPVVRVLVRMKKGETPHLTPDSDGYTISVNVTGTAKAHPARHADQAQVQQANPAAIQALPAASHEARAAAAIVQKVTLDFVNTDVVQILKALALQADVNIVTAPEVQGKRITVSLDKVTVKDALDFVTALAGLRYARVQDSYVVTTRDAFGSIMTDLADRSKAQNEIRIVPIISGDGAGIKTAVSRWFGPTSLQVILPGEDQKAGAAATPTPAAPTSGAADQGNAQAAAAAQQFGRTPSDLEHERDSKADGSVPYLVLIGDKKWVAQAEVLVHQLDNEVLSARDMSKRAHQALDDQQDAADHERAKMLIAARPAQTQQTYMVQNGIADDLKKVVYDSLKGTGVEILASPPKSVMQTIIVHGTSDSVDSTMAMLRQLDTGAGASSEIYTYDIKYADPRSLREDLVANVPGLIATNPPAAAGDPRIYVKNASFLQQGQTQATAQTGANGQAAAPVSGGQSQAGVGTSGATVQDVTLPFDNMEAGSVPMRLVLRGTHEQIAEGLKYLAQVDVAPKQLAIEMRVMELSKEDALKLGIDWSVLTGGAVKTINLNQGQTGIGNNTAPANSIGASLGLNKGTIGVTATLDAIANKNNLISRPNLLAMDGRESEIFVGDDIRYVQSIVSGQNGPTINSADVQVGVRLSVLPRIGGDGSITMDLRPVVSFLKGFNSLTSSGVTLNLPQTSLRISQNTVNVQSGETLAIGGLIQDQDVFNVQKVPILGDLPIVGQLFRSTTHDRTRTEIVFFLTVKEVEAGDREKNADPREMERQNKAEMPIPKRHLLTGK